MSRPPTVSAVDEDRQAALLDTSVKEINPYWLDPAQPLLVPANPLHYEAHELQQLKEVMKKQAQKNPAQFNSLSYINVLKRLAVLWDLINRGVTSESNLADDQGDVASDRKRSTAPEVGEGVPASVDSGVSPDNPFAGEGTSPV